jgi:DNA-binding LacI/PurR family transcriptional regulator
MAGRPKGEGRSKTATVSLRIAPELRARVEDAIEAHPYNPSFTSVIERGLALAIAEMTSHTRAALSPPPTEEERS